jgi:hypothetical protein
VLFVDECHVHHDENDVNPFVILDEWRGFGHYGVIESVAPSSARAIGHAHLIGCYDDDTAPCGTQGLHRFAPEGAALGYTVKTCLQGGVGGENGRALTACCRGEQYENASHNQTDGKPRHAPPAAKSLQTRNDTVTGSLLQAYRPMRRDDEARYRVVTSVFN